MDPKTFVSLWKAEKDLLMGALQKNEGLAGQKINSIGLDPHQQTVFWEAIDCILTDTFYSLLLGLDGVGSIGGEQQPFQIFDEKGRPITKGGDLEGEAFNQFHQPG